MRFVNLSCTMEVPIMGKMCSLQCNTQQDSYSRAQEMLPVIAELEDSLDLIVNGIGLNGVLMVARQANPDVPSRDKFRSLYRDFKEKLHSDPHFMQRVMTEMPKITQKYQTNNIVPLVSDPDFLGLLSR